MKALINRYPNTITSILAILILSIAYTLFIHSLSANQLYILLNY
jgi:hypothetical protein